MIDVLKKMYGVEYKEARKMAETQSPPFVLPGLSRRPEAVGSLPPQGAASQDHTSRGRQDPPLQRWQSTARQYAEGCKRRLWGASGKIGRDYLKDRGITEKTAKRFDLGLSLAKTFDKPAAWGLERKGKMICLNQGITIPYLSCGKLWKLQVKMLEPIEYPKGSGRMIKCLPPRGGVSAPLLWDDLQFNATLVICESEFDAMLVWQEAGKGSHRNLVDVTTWGGANAPIYPRWQTSLLRYNKILVVYDNDEAGQAGAERVRRTIGRAEIIQIPAHDVGEYVAQGGDLAQWIASLVNVETPKKKQDRAKETVYPVTLEFLPGTQIGLPKGQWEKTATGAIIATFNDAEQLAITLATAV
jgi:hypothetical protein